MPAVASADQPDVSVGGTFWSGAEVIAPVVKPVWTISVDNADYLRTSLAARTEGSSVYAFKDKKLAAFDLKTGKRRWVFGSGLTQMMETSANSIYAVSPAGRVYAVDKQSGRLRWSSAIASLKPSKAEPESISGLKLEGDTLYVSHGKGITALLTDSGKPRWSVRDENASFVNFNVMEADGVVICSFLMDGASMSRQAIEGYDKKTGKKLWEHYRESMPVKVQNGLFYSVSDNWEGGLDETPDRQVIFHAFNAHTGELKGTREYAWKLEGEPPYDMNGTSGSWMLAGNDLYLYQNTRVVKYDFSSYTPGAEPVQKWMLQSNVKPLHKIVLGRMLFQDNKTGNLLGMKLINGETVGWRGDNPPARIEVYGSTVYIAQTDGILHAIDVLTGAPVFSVRTGSRSFGPTLKNGRMLVIQSNGKLIGVQLPANVK